MYRFSQKFFSLCTVTAILASIVPISTFANTTLFATTGNNPQDIAIDSSGNIYTANYNGSNLTKITPAGIASPFGSPGTNPRYITVDGSGNVYTANLGSMNITKTTSGGVSTTYGTLPTSSIGGMAIDGSGNVYLTNQNSNNVYKIDPSGSGSVFGTTGSYPRGITIDGTGNIYTADYYSNTVTKITPDGSGSVFGNTGYYPQGITVDGSGNVYAVSGYYYTNNITKITPDGSTSNLGTIDTYTSYIKTDASGNIYTASQNNPSIIKTTPDGTSKKIGRIPSGNVSYGIVVDNSGNVYTIRAGSDEVDKITQIDTNPPVITLYGQNPQSVYVGKTYYEQGANWTDDPDGQGSATASGTVDTSQSGTYLVTYSYTDLAGNTGSGTRTVYVTPDTTPPTVNPSYGANYTLYTNHSFNANAQAYCYDNADAGYLNVATSGSVDTSQSGSYPVTYTCTDAAGNIGSGTTIFNVVPDTTPPSFSLYGQTDMTVYTGDYYNEPGYSYCYDNIDGGRTVTVSGSVNTTIAGTYPITYSCSDISNNTFALTRTVHVIADTEPPVITLSNGTGMTLYIGKSYTDGSYSCTDNRDGNCDNKVTASGNVDTSHSGSYTRTFTAIDNAGNTGTTLRTVNVIADTEPPVLTLYGDNPQEVVQNGSFTDAWGDCTDNADGGLGIDVTGGNTIANDGTINTSLTGSSHLYYSCTDSAGNTASGSRVVNVVPDTVAPVITLYGNANVTIPVGSTYNELGVSCNDNADGNCSGSVMISGGNTVGNDGNIDTSSTGTTTIKYSYTDHAGNTGSVNRTVNIGPDTTPPIITINGQNPLTIIKTNSCTQYQDAGATAIDDDPNYVGPITTSGADNIYPCSIANYTITYTTTDPSGNTATATRTVHVVAQNPVDLSIKKTLVNTGTILAGDIVTYRFTIKNETNNAFSGGIYVYDVAPHILQYPGIDTASPSNPSTVTTSNSSIQAVNYGYASQLGAVFTQYGNSSLILLSAGISLQAGASISFDISAPTSANFTQGIKNRAMVFAEDDPDILAIETAAQSGSDIFDIPGNNNISISTYDAIPPVVTLVGASTLNLPQGALYQEQGAKWTDNIDGSGTIVTPTSGTINTMIPGTYTLTYSYTDQAGNIGSVTRTVIISGGNAGSVGNQLGGHATTGGGGGSPMSSGMHVTGIAGALNISNVVKNDTQKPTSTPVTGIILSSGIPSMDLLSQPWKIKPTVKGPVTDEICTDISKVHNLSDLKISDLPENEFRSSIQKILMYRPKTTEESQSGNTLFPHIEDAIELNANIFRGTDNMTRGEYLTLLVRALACHVPESTWEDRTNTGSSILSGETDTHSSSLLTNTNSSIISLVPTIQSALTIPSFTDNSSDNFSQTGTMDKKKIKRVNTQSISLFTDIPSGSTLEKYIDYAVSQKWISGYNDGTFHPDAPISRGEAAKILSRAIGLSALGIGASRSYDFQDVSPQNEFGGYIYALAEKGVLKGKSETLFQPDDSISRQEGAKIFANTFLKGVK